MVNYEELNTYQRINYIFLNIQAFLSLLGITGNLLSICIFSTKSLRKHSYSFYWRVMASSDTLILVEIIKNWANIILDINIQFKSPLFCKINRYFAYVGGYISLWTLSLISVDRLVVIAYPYRLQVFQRRWFQLSLVSIVVVYSVLVNLQLPLNYRFEVFNATNYTSHVICYLPSNNQYIHSIMMISNSILVNLLINSVLHAKLIFAIRSVKKKATGGNYRYSVSASSALRDRKFAIISIVMNIASCLFKIPLALVMYASSYFQLTYDQHHMFLSLAVAIIIVNHGDLFFINMALNSIFHKHFFLLIQRSRQSISNNT